MNWFYATAVAIVILLALSPFWFLKKADLSDLEGKIVAYGTYGAKVKSIDPATCGDTTSAGIQGAFYEAPYSYHYLKRPLELIPQLAEAMPEASPDGLTYTIRIKKDIRYHRNACFGTAPDGTPKTRAVRAEDFVLAFKRIADSHIETGLALAFIQDKIVGVAEYFQKTKDYAKGDFSRYDLPLEGVRAVDARTLKIRLKVPFPQLVYVLAINTYAPVPHEVIDYYLQTRPAPGGARAPLPMNERVAEIHEPAAAVGTGAYYLAEWIKANKIVLKRNPDYRIDLYPSEGAPGDKEAGLLADAGKRVPFVDVRYLTFVAEDNPMWMLFMTKQSDTVSIPRDVYENVVTPDKQLAGEWAKQGIRLEKSSMPVVYWLAFNMADPVVGAGKSLRQALNLVYNVREHIDVLYNGRGIRARTYVPSSFDGYKQALSPYAKLDIALAKKKMRQARKELEAAGAIGPGDPIPPLTLDMPGLDEPVRRAAEFAQGQFKKLGIDLRIVLNDWPTLQRKVHRKQCQMYAMGWHADYSDPENFLQLYYSPNIKRGTNNTNYDNPAFDALYEKVSVMGPSPERTAIYVQMLKMLNEDSPCILLSEPFGFFLAYSWVHNIKPHPIGYGFGKYRRIDAEARRKAGGR